jgi:flavodoxin
MVLDGRIPEHIDLILSFELAKSIRGNLDDETIKCLIFVKKLIEPIKKLEYDNIIEFSKVWASTEVYHEINDKMLPVTFVIKARKL